MADDSVLLIDRGDPPSLAAAAVESDRAHLIAWHQLEPDAAAARRRSAAERHVAALGMPRLLLSDPPVIGVPSMAPPSDRMFRVRLLLEAVAVAEQIGCRRVIWAEQLEPLAAEIGERVLLANTVAMLASGDETPARVEIAVPLIDLSDAQIIDLIDDAGAPLEGCWPCEGDGRTPCGACTLCERWMGACERVGLSWPWPRDLAAAT